MCRSGTSNNLGQVLAAGGMFDLPREQPNFLFIKNKLCLYSVDEIKVTPQACQNKKREGKNCTDETE